MVKVTKGHKSFERQFVARPTRMGNGSVPGAHPPGMTHSATSFIGNSASEDESINLKRPSQRGRDARIIAGGVDRRLAVEILVDAEDPVEISSNPELEV
jgi:hypothetical protein